MDPRHQQSQNNPQAARPPVDAAPASDTVKVKLLRGRMLISRTVKDGVVFEETYKDEGDVFEMNRAEAEKLAKRSFEGYPCNINPNDGSITVAKLPAPNGVKDSPIEILN